MMNVAFSPFEPTRKRNLFAHVVEELGSRIVGGHFKPGETLPNEADLGREIGASRSVIREAVKSLASKGLLEARTRVGTTRAPADAMEFARSRRAPLALRGDATDAVFPGNVRDPPHDRAGSRLARGRTRNGRRSSRSWHRPFATSKPPKNRVTRRSRADIRFHRSILNASHNELIMQMGALISVGLMISFPDFLKLLRRLPSAP